MFKISLCKVTHYIFNIYYIFISQVCILYLVILGFCFSGFGFCFIMEYVLPLTKTKASDTFRYSYLI